MPSTIKDNEIYKIAKLPNFRSEQPVYNRQNIDAIKHLNKQIGILQGKIRDLEERKLETFKYIKGTSPEDRSLPNPNGEVQFDSSNKSIKVKTNGENIDLKLIGLGSFTGTFITTDGLTPFIDNWNAGPYNISSAGNILLSAGYIDSKAYYYIDGSKFISVDGTGNMMIGEGAGNGGVSTGGTHIGYRAGFSTEAAGIDSVNIGFEAGLIQTTAIGCVNIGGLAGHSMLTQGYTVNIGYKAGRLGIARYNINIGYKAGELATHTNAYGNVNIGYTAGQQSVIGQENINIGSTANREGLGKTCIFIGYNVAVQIPTTLASTVIGTRAMINNAVSITYSTVIGAYACTQSRSAIVSSVVIGSYACYTNNAISNAQATVLGTYGGYFATDVTNSIFVGHKSGYRETQPNKLYIDSLARGGTEALGRTGSLVYGVFDATVANQFIRFNGTVQLYQDNLYMKWGAGGDSGVKDDGSNMIFDCDIGSVTGREFQFQNGFLRTENADYRRYYHLPIAAFDPGASGATWTDPDANTLGGWQLDNAGEIIFSKVDVHDDWDGVSDLTAEIFFEVNIDNSGGNVGDTVDIKMVSYYKGAGESSNKTQAVEVATVVDQSPQYKLYKVELVIDHDFADNVIENGDQITICLNLETDTSEVDDIVITSASYYYNTKHVGIESGDA
ncbi:hypothetical protein KAR91_27815 [Candidatus Pacearchaeota archaeon]|nr:hypothetical protein [Candidatus Pacearchaeota archaeon]